MNKVQVNVLLDRVVVKPDKVMPKAGSGLVLPMSLRPDSKIQAGTIVQIGEKVDDFKVGERVLYERDKSQDLEHRGALGCEVLRREDICAKLKSTKS